ncbi:MAG: GNAT family N-acetyltransferase [Anaerolineae bacterium]|nr:GNAT family N-acetyltransferase [Anaerolineae bacterium]
MKTDTSPDNTSFRMGPADPDQHRMAIAQITADAFANGQYVEEISQQYIGNCHYDWNTTRLIWDGERLIHHWGVWGYPMRLGSIHLKVAGIGAVVTEEPYRKRGLMAMAATDSFDAMRKNGYDLSVLRGRHYVKFGYARAWNYVTYRLKPEEIPDRDIQQPYETLGPEHMDAINAVYNQDHQAFSGTAVRPTYRMLKAGDMGAYGWFDDAGQLAGYVRAMPTDDKTTLQCLEAAGDPDQGLAVLAELFKKEPYETLTFFTMPHQHPMLQIIRRGACIVETRYFDQSGWRVRIVNLHSTLEKLRPMLETRLEQSRFANWQGELHLDAGEQNASLAIDNGSVTITQAPPGEHTLHGGANIARFLIGSDDPGEIIQQTGMVCTGQAAALTTILFPNCYPMMSHWDEY